MNKDPLNPERIRAFCEARAEEFPIQEFLKLPAEDQELCLKEMIRRERADLLSALNEMAGSRKEAKAIRRALHQLRSRGVMVEAKDESRNFVLPRPEVSGDRAYVTPVGAGGDQAVWLFLGRRGREVMFQAFVDDHRGFLDFTAARLTRKRFEKFIKQTKKDADEIPVFETSPDHARWLISRAEDRSRNSGSELPEEFKEFRSMIGALPEADKGHPLQEKLKFQGIKDRRGLLHQASELLGHSFFLGWLFPGDAVKACELKLNEIEASPIVMNNLQKKDRMERVFEDEARKAVNEEGRGLWKDRLIENAYLLLMQGEADKAELALATALAMDDDVPPPFFAAMMKRSFQTQPREKKLEGKIIIP